MKNSFRKPLKEQKGVTLIMALLILAGISATSLTTSIIIVNELMASKNTDEAIMAYYAAETGAEKGLYHFKVHKDDSAQTIKSFSLADEHLGNGSKITAASITQQSGLMTNLTKNQTIQLNLYNPDDLDDDATKVDIIEISGTAAGTGNPNDPEAKLEVSYISWPNPGGGQLTWSGGGGETNYPTTTEIYTKSDLAAGERKDFSAQFLVYHIVRLKALYNDVVNLKIEAKKTNSPNQPTDVPIPTGFEIASSGEYKSAKQKVTANVHWQKTVNGLFNYVLFTKEELEKK